MYTTTDFVVNDADGRPVVTNPKNVEMVDMTIFTHLDGAVSPAGIPEPTDLTGWVDFLNNGVGAASVSEDDPSRGKTAAPATTSSVYVRDNSYGIEKKGSVQGHAYWNDKRIQQ